MRDIICKYPSPTHLPPLYLSLMTTTRKTRAKAKPVEAPIEVQAVPTEAPEIDHTAEALVPPTELPVEEVVVTEVLQPLTQADLNSLGITEAELVAEVSDILANAGCKDCGTKVTPQAANTVTPGFHLESFLRVLFGGDPGFFEECLARVNSHSPAWTLTPQYKANKWAVLLHPVDEVPNSETAVVGVF